MVGIIYLGTPHTGTTAATAANKILTIVKSIDLAMVNLSIIQELEKGSSTLFELQSSMHARYKHCKVICFYETVPDSKTKVMVNILGLRITYDKVLRVLDCAARVGLLGRQQ